MLSDLLVGGPGLRWTGRVGKPLSQEEWEKGFDASHFREKGSFDPKSSDRKKTRAFLVQCFLHSFLLNVLAICRGHFDC